MEMTKKKPRGHNIGGSYKQKRRKEKKGKSQISAKQDLEWMIRKKWMEMTKKKPRGHNTGGSYKQKRRKEKKGKSQISAKQDLEWTIRKKSEIC